MIIIKKDVFKTIHIVFNFLEKIENDAFAYRFLLTRVLSSYTPSYPTKKKLIDAFAKHYGSFVSNHVSIFGNYHILKFTFLMPDPALVGDDAMFASILKLAHEMFFDRPLFKQDIFDEAKRHLLNYVKSLPERKFEYGRQNFYKYAFPNHPLGHPMSGTYDEIKSITVEDLYDYYQRYFHKNVLRITASGPINETQEQQLKTVFSPHETISIEPVSKLELLKVEPTVHEDNTPMQQALIYLGYYTQIDRNHPLYYALVIAVLILGGYPESRLFKTFREEMMLAYEVDAAFEFDKQHVLVFAGVDTLDKDQSLETLKSLIDEYIKEGPTAFELKNAKVFLKTQVLSNQDQQPYLTSRAFMQEAFGINEPFMTYMERIENITLEDIYDALSLIELQTTYTLHGGYQDEDFATL